MGGRSLSEKVSLVVAGTGLRAVAETLVVILLVRLLTPHEFGTLRQALLVFMTLASVGSVAIPTCVFYFLPRLRAGELSPFLVNLVAMVLGMGMALAGVLFISSGWLANGFNNIDAAGLLKLGCLYPAFYLLVQVVPAYLVATDRHRSAGLVNMLLALVHVLAAAVPAWLGLGAGGIVGTMTAAWAALAGAGWVFLASESGWPGLDSFSGWPRRILRYGAPLSLNAMVGTLNQRVDRYLIAVSFAPSLFAVYSAGAMEVPLVPVLAYTVASVLIPQFSGLDQAGKRGEILPLWHRSIGKTVLIMMPLFGFLMLFAGDLIILMLTREYAAATSIFRVYLLLLPLRLTSYGSVLQALGRPDKVLMASCLGLCTNLVVGMILLLAVGWTGPAWAAILAQFAMIVFLLWQIARVVNVRVVNAFPVRACLPAVLCSALASAPAGVLLLFLPSGPARLVWGGAVYAAVYGAAIKVSGAVQPGDLATMKRLVTLRAFGVEGKG